jgi:hypothetical protein
VLGSLKHLLLFQMAVIFNEKGVQDCHPPCVAQSFINHNAVLYKIYVVGDEYIVTERPSLKNFYPCGMSYTIKNGYTILRLNAFHLCIKHFYLQPGQFAQNAAVTNYIF